MRICRLSNYVLIVIMLISQYVKSNDNSIGSLLFFDKPCPSGYRRYTQADGKVIIAEGQNTDKNGVQMTFNLGESNGEYRNKLTISEMPAHNHNNGGLTLNRQYTDGKFNAYFSMGGGSIAGYDNPKTSTDGMSQAHNNVQPYTVLYLCIKEESSPSTEELQAKIDSQQILINNQLSNMALQQEKIDNMKENIEKLERNNLGSEKNKETLDQSFVFGLVGCAGTVIALILGLIEIKDKCSGKRSSKVDNQQTERGNQELMNRKSQSINNQLPLQKNNQLTMTYY